ncbi:protein of unknown function [Paracidovorax cattleyae]|uniref:DUF4142 domain-containing protein n=1 Tax=Paracidovorax cattleyae TaxID=80868 RepID=A0A1H0LHV0_9BURK|nr:protein of unknown function [Paracidovorax cattleyae]
MDHRQLVISASVVLEGQASRLTRADKSFRDDAAHNGHAEVRSSQLALQKARNPKVRAFAQQMVDDHTQANQQLAALAAGKNMRRRPVSVCVGSAAVQAMDSRLATLAHTRRSGPTWATERMVRPSACPRSGSGPNGAMPLPCPRSLGAR